MRSSLLRIHRNRLIPCMPFLLLIRKLQKPQQQRRGQRRFKNEFTFCLRISRYPKVIYFNLFITAKAITKLNHDTSINSKYKFNKLALVKFMFSKQRKIWSLHVVVFQTGRERNVPRIATQGDSHCTSH